VLPSNQRMLQVFRDLGFAEHARFEDGVVRVRVELPA
jgi:ssDNA-specific exonuclease RecJ